MSKQIDALKLALEALERHAELGLLAGSTITAIREALAEQPAQGCEFCSHPLYAGTKCKNCGREQPAQPSKPWVGLTDEEVDECYYWKGRQWTTDELVRHVEAKLREKNA